MGKAKAEGKAKKDANKVRVTAGGWAERRDKGRAWGRG